MQIGDVADRSGLPAKTIRYYEDIGLVTPARDTNGYRLFGESDMHRLSFVARARALGFTIKQCRSLLELWGDQERASADVRAVAGEQLVKIEAKIADLEAMRDTLSRLMHDCSGDARPDCPILDTLGGDAAKVAMPLEVEPQARVARRR